MSLSVYVFESLNQKIMYIKDISYYFEINDIDNIESGEYHYTHDQFLDFISKYKPELYDKLNNIQERLSYMKFDKDEIMEQEENGEYILCLHPSRKCNLNCKYCFKEENYLLKEKLSAQTAKNAINFLINNFGKYASKYIVDLAGSGEPMLEFNLVKEIVEYCDNKRNEIGINIEIMFPTNATKLTQEMVEYIDSHSNIIIGVSIDGDKTFNDNNRVYKDGTGTYKDIVKGINSLKNKKPGLAVTITPLNQEVDLIYDHLYHLDNVDCVSMKFLRLYDGSAHDFDNFDINYLMSRYELLCNNIFEELENNNFNYLRVLLQGADHFGSYIKDNLFKGFASHYRCDAGRRRIAVNAKGDIYTCSVMLGNEDFYLGNIYEGINKEKQNVFWESNVLNSQSCMNCWASNLCGGECYSVSYLKNNNLFEPYESKCVLKQELLKLSIAFLVTVEHKYPDMYQKLIEFIFSTQKYHESDSAVWAINKILRHNGIMSQYSDIVENIDMDEYGVHPSNVLNYLQEFSKDLNAYQLDSVESYRDISYPAISIVNKMESPTYSYTVLLGEEDGQLSVCTMKNSEIMTIPFDKYHSQTSNIVIAKAK